MIKISIRKLNPVSYFVITAYLEVNSYNVFTMYKYLIRPLAFRMSADMAHETALQLGTEISKSEPVLKAARMIYDYSDPSLEQVIQGLKFRNPVGLAAGFDKNGTLAPLMQNLGFGFVEIGSITANPSSGNPKPRSFRLPEDHSIINRMGLNNDGAHTISRRLKKLSLDIPLGINIAKTHDPSITGKKALIDYKTSFDVLKEIGDYFTINISCPNTTEGKTFEEPEALDQLLNTLDIDRDSMISPVLVKFSVDLSDELLSELISVCESHSISGYVACNTSSRRDQLVTSEKTVAEIGAGGLSGRAIRERSTEIIHKIKSLSKGNKIVIGVGGISSGRDAIEKLKAGADLLQIYTGMIYEGPSLIKKINKEISEYLKSEGLKHIYEMKRPR